MNLSRLFIVPWLASALFTALGLIDYVDFFEPMTLVVALPALVAWALMPFVKRRSPRPPRPRRNADLPAPSWTFFLVLCGLSLAGNLALMQAYSGLAGASAATAQESYVALVSGDVAGDTGFLGSLGQLLRIAQPFAVICAVFMIAKPNRRPMSRLSIGILIALVIYVGYLASISRGQFLLIGACAGVALLRVGVPARKLLLVVALLAFGGVVLFSQTSESRYEVLGVSSDVIGLAIGQLFRIEPESLAAPWVETVGINTVGLLIYLTQPLVECFRLLQGDPSPYFLGTYTFRPLINPIARLFGLTLDTSLVDRLQHPNMWYSLLGDLYLDFGYACFLILPALCVFMYALAVRYSSRGFWGQSFVIVTASFFVIFPLHSAFLTFGTIYAAALAFAIAERLRSRPARSPSRRQLMNPLSRDLAR